MININTEIKSDKRVSVLEIEFYSPSTVQWHDNMDFQLELGKIQICDEFNT